MRSALFFSAIIALASYVQGARILGLFPHTGRSHQMVYEPLLHKLAERGHHISVVSFFPLKNPPANYTDFSLEGIAGVGLETFNLEWYENPSIFTRIPILGRMIDQLMQFLPLGGMALEVCSKAVDWLPLKEAMQKDYDLVLVESFNSDCMMGLLHVYDIKAPAIALLSSSLMPWSADRIGVTDNPSYVPILSTPFTPRMTLLERIENTFLVIFYKLWYRYAVQLKEQGLIEKEFRRKIPDLDILSRNISLMFLNTFHVLNGVKPLVPGIVEVGGMHLDPTRKTIPTIPRREVREMRLIYKLFVIFTLTNSIHGAKILGLFPHTGKSHFMVFQPLLKRLAERGHHLTVASVFPLEDPPSNYTNIKLDGFKELGVDIFNLKAYEDRGFFLRIPILGGIIKQIIEYNLLAQVALTLCNKVIQFSPLTEALKEDYDLVIIENFNSDCVLGLLQQYGVNAPVVSLLSCPLMPWSSDLVGVTDNPAYVPVVSSSFTPKMTLLERMENTFMLLYHKIWFRYMVQLKEQAILEKHFGRQIQDLNLLAKNISLLLVNTHPALNGAKPLAPGVVEVGGMHLDPNRTTLPAYIERFVNESEHGVILLSFGSLIKTSTIPKYKEDIILNTLAKFKQRVVWKYEDSDAEGTLVGNVLKVKWLPQFELLQHKNVIAFIAHGGLLGMTESIYAGKPMVVVPFFGDQPANAAAAAAAGFARVLSYMDFTEKDLTEALQSVLSEEMRVNARRVSKIWQDRESAPLDTAVYWTERVLRWGHSAPLHTAARDLAVYELALIDVFAAYALAFTIIILSVWFVLSKIRRLFVKEGKKKTE